MITMHPTTTESTDSSGMQLARCQWPQRLPHKVLSTVDEGVCTCVDLCCLQRVAETMHQDSMHTKYSNKPSFNTSMLTHCTAQVSRLNQTCKSCRLDCFSTFECAATLSSSPLDSFKNASKKRRYSECQSRVRSLCLLPKLRGLASFA